MSLAENERETIRKKLLEEKKKIDKHIASLKEQDPYSDPERLIDNAASDTEASEESDHERVEALLKELTGKSEAVQNALLEIGKKSFGKCLKCGSRIQTARLLVNPTAVYCIECERNKG